ncbi:hypothetical protein [Hymenobacter cheonanensis]|uniref:hypothetical protein n=1 Tax=Hymenobacter sp. CA2-7 TaxID=3063993 RepID=UPI002713D041|nr:hypothetical protein [Hymenobacter sp. CA2-7]MDO7884588.1 hypothetical protein [Hymenobacter sp. CA2-7]
MLLTYPSPTPQWAVANQALLSPAEETAYLARLREVENALLCQAFGGQVPQPGSQLRLQRYLNGEINRAEAFQPGHSAARCSAS